MIVDWSYIDVIGEACGGHCNIYKALIHILVAILVAKLLCGILLLELETGRYQGVDKKNRVCRVCGTGAVEDEITSSSAAPASETPEDTSRS